MADFYLDHFRNMQRGAYKRASKIMVFILLYQRKDSTKEWRKCINYCPQSSYINYQEHLCVLAEHKLIGYSRQNTSNDKKRDK